MNKRAIKKPADGRVPSSDQATAKTPVADSNRVLQSSESTAESAVITLLNHVGARVYKSRKTLRLSRRELSEQSGVSPRYIARLESGDGNISIGLLQRIATALDRPIDWLVAEDEPLNSELARVVMLYRKADAATRAKVLYELDPDQLLANKAERLCLIGLRGAGKSTLGARLGEQLSVPFIELNQEIERSAGMPVSEVIAMYGGKGYRKLEADTLATLVETRNRMVLAVAGGVVEEMDTFACVLNGFHTVWLKADPAEHMERVRAQGDLRPMAGNPKAMEQLREILVARESRYRQAEYHVNTSGKTIDESLSDLSSLINTHQLIS